MRTSFAILTAAIVGFGGASLSSAPASAATATPLVHHGATSNVQMDTVQFTHRGWRGHRGWHRGHRGWHRGHRGYRDRTGRALGAGLLGFGAGLALSQLAQPRYHTYGTYPRYRTYGGQPQYRVYGGDPYYAPRGQAGTTMDSRAPSHRP